MAGGDIDARCRAKLPDGKAQLGRGAAVPEQPDGDAPAAHHMGGFFGKKPAVDAAVIADADALFGLSGFQNHLSKSLGGLPDDVFIHAVETHAHQTPQTCGAKGQRPVKPVTGLFVRQPSQLLPLTFGQLRGVQPALIRLTMGHKKLLSAMHRFQTNIIARSCHGFHLF